MAKLFRGFSLGGLAAMKVVMRIDRAELSSAHPMKICIALLAASAWVLFIVGCSPSLDDAKLVLQQQVASQSRGCVKLVSYTKTDVQEFQVKGGQECRIRYEATIEFKENGLWSKGVGSESLNFEFSPNPRTAEGESGPNPRAAEGVAAQMINELQGHRQMRQDDRIKIVGVITGTKSQNGWKYEPGESHTTD